MSLVLINIWVNHETEAGRQAMTAGANCVLLNYHDLSRFNTRILAFDTRHGVKQSKEWIWNRHEEI